MYSISQLADLTGVSPRTLRYYDQINLLKPTKLSEKGYRLYTDKDINRLQQILFFKTFDFSLKHIKKLMTLDEQQIIVELTHQHQLLTQELAELTDLTHLLDKSIKNYKGEITMTTSEKFEHLINEKIKENEERYGFEIRELYDEQTISNSNAKWQNLNQDDYNAMISYEKEIITGLNFILESKQINLPNLQAEKIFNAHKAWLQITAPYYSIEYHRYLADLYVADERFANYYNEKTIDESAEILQEIILFYTK
ncbi:MerR family transcriptional regulator [Vagococcus vulneris]|uniref:MerR family transcriptional regulator n=1 Tax=Vagococcus vulneris TaxID=1977869 RepID=UPI00140302FD|nr:MerR family transcriptional regulator [Vagococcus vulneris]